MWGGGGGGMNIQGGRWRNVFFLHASCKPIIKKIALSCITLRSPQLPSQSSSAYSRSRNVLNTLNVLISSHVR